MPKKRRRLQMQNKAEPSQAMNPIAWLVSGRRRALEKKYRATTPRRVQLDVSGSEAAFEARSFHAWLNGRDIPIDELCILFNRDEQTIRRWLQMKV